MSELMDRIKKLQEEQARMELMDRSSGRDILKMLMDKEGKRPGTVAAELGISRQCMSAKMNRNSLDIPASDLAKMLATLGYDLVIVKRGEFDDGVGIKIK